MGWSTAATVGGYVALGGLALFALRWLVKSGGIREKAETLEREVEGNVEFEKRGEAWNRRGGLLAIARDRVSKLRKPK